MGRAPCCSKVGLHRGPWTPREDILLTKYIQAHGEGHWRSLPKKAGLLRCGKSCRLRWMNYLRPNIKRGNITPDEDDLIIRLHSLLGNRWSLIAGRLPGRTDNEIKNYWNTHLRKKLRAQGTDPNTHKKLIIEEPVLQDQSKISKKNKNNNKSNMNNIRKLVVKNKKYKSIANINIQDVDQPQKPKVHLPKPVRVTSLSMIPIQSFQRNAIFNAAAAAASSGTSKQENIKEGSSPCIGFGSKVEDNPWSFDSKNGENINGVIGLLNDGGDQDQDHGTVDMNGLDFDQCQYSNNLATGDKSLEKLYEEYLELLKTEENHVHELDAFAESCLVI
ncbi:hypothetical protein I3843_02G033400 [Carya illinoinensis]|uniref:Uncharacterized protein n=1 Tax=Carya illinoinensis TaxID=32201 RepID=A0A8T1R8F7_CARIL|nr:myb-related protein 308-like [Carya illinoinensis]KAG6663700.1 hypothetical protein CIPAW_02G041700 [Carya illinoinensis]KAG6725647.1 hypothetical protein I3842_02G042200 [Carya illinoinensis]KAG7990605.1 hypothetical protein I3843_02G033400 [Carya illinoinensis]